MYTRNPYIEVKANPNLQIVIRLQLHSSLVLLWKIWLNFWYIRVVIAHALSVYVKHQD